MDEGTRSPIGDRCSRVGTASNLARIDGTARIASQWWQSQRRNLFIENAYARTITRSYSRSRTID